METRFDVNHIVLYVDLHLPSYSFRSLVRRVVVALMEEV